MADEAGRCDILGTHTVEEWVGNCDVLLFRQSIHRILKKERKTEVGLCDVCGNY